MSMARTYKTVAFSIPPEMAEKMEKTAREKLLTKSEFFREMFRMWEQQEQSSREEQVNRFRQLSREGYQEAKLLGINAENEEEINSIVYEARQARKRENGVKGRS